MRIAVWHNLPSGGGKRALYDHVRGLISRGHTVEAWCPQTADREFLPLSSLIPEHVVDLAWPGNDGRLSQWRIGRKVEAMNAHCRQCADEINKGGFDILLANPCQFLMTTSIGHYVESPSLLYLQEPYRNLYEALPRLWWLAPPSRRISIFNPTTWRPPVGDWFWVRSKRIQGREEVENARAYKTILVNSYYSRESLLRAYGLNADVCYLGIDTTHFVDRGFPREDYIVGLGSVTPSKNLNLVIEAIGALATPRPKLIWIGNFSSEEYQKSMTKLAMEREVALELKIRISDDEVIELLNRAFAMVYVPRLEPFGLAPLEANACGVPVIAAREGGVRETIRHEVNGLLAEPTPTDLAAAVQRLRDNPVFARQLGTAGRKLVSAEWSMGAATSRLERYLLSCLSESPKPMTLNRITSLSANEAHYVQ